MEVPDTLLSGDHKKIAQWRLTQRMLRTRERRPDLWQKYLQDNPDALAEPKKKQRRRPPHDFEI